MHVHARGELAAGRLEHGGPEEGVEVDDVLADEVDDVAVGVPRPVRLDVLGWHLLLRPVLGGAQVADRRVEPDVEVLGVLAGDLEAEVRRVAGDVPVAQGLREPAVDRAADLGLQGARGGPPLEELLVVREAHEVVRARAAHWRHLAAALVPAEGAVGLEQIGGVIGGPALLAGVTILVARITLGADPLDVAVWEEPLVDLAVELLDGAQVDGAGCFQGLEERARVLLVLRRVRRVELVEGDPEGGVVPLVLFVEPRDELLGRHPCLGGAHLDRRAVGVVGAEVDRLAAGGLERAYVDVGLHRLDEVAEVDAAVGVRQRHGDEGLGRGGAGHRGESV